MGRVGEIYLRDIQYIVSMSHVYIVVEENYNLPFSSSNNLRMICAATNLDEAMKYIGPNRFIKGPVPVIDHSSKPMPDLPVTFSNYTNQMGVHLTF